MIDKAVVLIGVVSSYHSLGTLALPISYNSFVKLRVLFQFSLSVSKKGIKDNEI